MNYPENRKLYELFRKLAVVKKREFEHCYFYIDLYLNLE